MSTPVLTLEYATAHPILDGHARRAFGELLLLSILSGLCVGVCFLAMLWGMFGAILQLGVFAVTIVLAVRNGMSLSRLPSVEDAGHGIRRILDSVAGVGLVGIGLAGLVYYLLEGSSMQGVESFVESFGAGLLGIAYGLLAVTTWRHVILYRFLADLCRASNHPSMATRLSRLGWGKMIYEGLWLACCSITLLLLAAHSVTHASGFQDVALFFAFASLFGAMGFGGIWIWMIVVHAVLFRLARPN